MFEVVPAGDRWTYRLICAAGRVLVYTAETFDSDNAAANAAKAYRSDFWALSDRIDHRQARAV